MSGGAMGETVSAVVRLLGRDWKKAKRRADADDRVRGSDLQRLRSVRSYRVTTREVAFQVMEEAYQMASGGGRYPANARQIYYAARPAILARADTDKVDSQYFTQTLLKEYLEEHQPAWDVVWDARGHFTEPYTEEVIGLGGLDVRRYVGGFTDGRFPEAPPYSPQIRVPTTGPQLRYGGVLFIEKEGFDPLLKASRLAERCDLAIASTKGMPVSAFCDLLGVLREHERKVYVVHDFDKSGFSIAATLRHGTRGSRGTGTVVDLGLRLADVEGLQTEEVHYSQRENPASNLRQNGATADEIAMLVQRRGYGSDWYGQRVELNAMTSDQFVTWLEGKLEAAGVSKLVPAEETLVLAYQRATYLQTLQKESATLRQRVMQAQIEIPADLAERVSEALEEDPGQSWDTAVWHAAQDDREAAHG